MNSYNQPYDNNLEETSDKRRKISDIVKDLDSGDLMRGDIFCYWRHEYRYVWNWEFQRFPIWKVKWFHINYLEWPFFKLTDWKFNNTEKKETKKRTKPNKPKNKPQLTVDEITKNISDAKQYLRDNTWKLSVAEETWVKETIQKMEDFLKSQKYDPRNLPAIIDTTKNTLPAIMENQWGEKVPQGTFKSPEISNLWEEELPAYPHPENQEWEDKPEEKLEKLVLFNIPESRELHGINVSEISNHLVEIATKRANERLIQERSEKSIFGKAGMFFTRSKRLQQLIDEELEKLKEGWTFAPQSRKVREYASDRNESENSLFGNIEASKSIFIPEINVLAAQFIHGEIDQKEFERDFEKIISEHEACTEMQDRWSNILLELVHKRAVFANIKAQNFDAIFTNPRQRDFLRYILGLEEINENNWEAIKLSFQSDDIQSKLMNQDIEVSIDIYTDTNNAAFEVQDNAKVDSALYNTGKTLQKHPWISAGLYAGTIWAASFLTAGAGIVVWAWVTALWALGIWGKTGARRYAEYTDAHNQAEDRIVAGDTIDLSGENHGIIRKMLWRLQKSDVQLYWITRDVSEHNQRPRQENLNQNSEEQKTTDNTIDTKNNTSTDSWRGDALTQSVWTMHHHFMPIERINTRFEKFLRGESLRNDENADKNGEAIDAYLAQGLARLDMHRLTGHNFFRTTKKGFIEDRKWHMEQQMSELQKNIFLVSQARWLNLWDIVVSNPEYDFEDTNNARTLRNSPVYLGIIDKLNADLEFANTRFGQIRRSTSLKTAAITWGVYALTSSILWLLTGGTETTTWQSTTYTTPSWTTTTPGSLGIDTNIATQLEASLGTTRYQTFISNIQSATGPETLWDTLTDDIFNNTNLGNDAKNQIMTFILNATDIQAGLTKPELLIEAGNQGIFRDIASNSSRINTVMSRLSEWGYGNIDKTWLTNTITWINNGSVTVSSLNPNEQVIVSEALWCYVHRNAAGWAMPMFEVFMDRLPDIVTTHPGEEITIPWETTTITTSGIWWAGVPTWRNTFLPKKQDVNQVSNDNNNTTQAEVDSKPEDDNIPKTDA